MRKKLYSKGSQSSKRLLHTCQLSTHWALTRVVTAYVICYSLTVCEDVPQEGEFFLVVDDSNVSVVRTSLHVRLSMSEIRYDQITVKLSIQIYMTPHERRLNAIWSNIEQNR